MQQANSGTVHVVFVLLVYITGIGMCLTQGGHYLQSLSECIYNKVQTAHLVSYPIGLL